MTGISIFQVSIGTFGIFLFTVALFMPTECTVKEEMAFCHMPGHHNFPHCLWFLHHMLHLFLDKHGQWSIIWLQSPGRIHQGLLGSHRFGLLWSLCLWTRAYALGGLWKWILCRDYMGMSSKGHWFIKLKWPHAHLCGLWPLCYVHRPLLLGQTKNSLVCCKNFTTGNLPVVLLAHWVP